MNVKEFQDDVNNIIDPNLSTSQKRKVTPKDLGFAHQEPEKKKRPVEPILDDMDKAIARKQKEARLLSDAIDESDGEGISEEEFQDILAQAKHELDDDDGIPVSTQQVNEITDKILRKADTTLPTDNPATNLMEELEEEISKDDEDYENETSVYAYDSYNRDEDAAASDFNVSEQVETVATSAEEVNNPFKNFQSGDINFDEESEELDENIDEKTVAQKEQKEQVEKLRYLIRQKIRPVTKSFDISTYSISNKPATPVISTPKDRGEKIADWVLMSSNRPIYMRKFTGTEIERLSNGGKGRSRMNRALDTWQLIYDHIVDPHKPDTLEKWAKVTSFLDIEHIYMAIYRANFEGSNYIPYNCTNPSCKDKVFLSDNFDIMDMCKFGKEADKAKFESILGSETSPAHGLYATEIIPVSDDFAFAFREPSIYNIIFESAMLDEDFVEKFGDLISICAYIDQVYKIDHERRELQPIRTNIYPNNMKKTIKSRIINFSKYISRLESDQYNTIVAYMNKINESGNELTYQLPEVTCPACKTVIPATDQEAQSLVFTRHQLAALATL